MAKRTHGVDLKVVEKNVKAMQAFYAKQMSEKNTTELFEEDRNVILQFDFAMKPALKNKSFFFDVAKSPVFDPETSEVCVIVKDVKGVDKYEQREDMKKEIRVSCPYITEVFPYKMVKTDFRTFEQKRNFCQSYDFFVADRDVFHTLPVMLGTTFIKARKMPRKVNNIDARNATLDATIRKALGQAFWWVDGRGTCTSIIIGKSNWTTAELLTNIEQVLIQVAKVTPRGWNFIKSVHVKTETSIALEIYRKGEDIEVPLVKDALELAHVKRNDMPDNELVKTYKGLIQNKMMRRKKTYKGTKKPMPPKKKKDVLKGVLKA